LPAGRIWGGLRIGGHNTEGESNPEHFSVNDGAKSPAPRRPRRPGDGLAAFRNASLSSFGTKSGGKLMQKIHTLTDN
jgi:hypothetical protein